MDDNGFQLMIVDGLNGYILTLSSGVFAIITDSDMPKASCVKYLDGYFILNQANSRNVWITSLYDGFDIDGLDFAVTDVNPNKILAVESLLGQGWVFGEESIQVYFYTGGVDFPFSQVGGASIETGIAAPKSLAKINQSLFWLGKNKDGQGIVYMASGYQAQRISTTAIEFAIQGSSDIGSAVGFGYQQEGATFYVLNFSEATWVFDLATGIWHERAGFDNGIFERDRANTHAFFNNTHVVGDHENGNLYAIDLDYHKYGDQPRKWLRSSPHIASELKYIYYNNFQVDLEFGVGTNTGQGADPVITLRTSNDGGHSWGNERAATMGKIGEFKARANFSRCGRSRDRVFEVSGTDPVRVALLGAYIETAKGSR
jgi:hypothetical protein